MSQQKNIISRIYVSPCGPMVLHAMGDCLVACLWDNRSVTGGESPVIDRAIQQLDEYFDGKRTSFDIRLSAHGTEFQRRVWRALTEIEFGDVMTYGELAAHIGNPDAARATGRAVGANPLNIFVPCHRIVGAGNTIGGYAGGLAAKRYLLGLERAMKEKCNKKSLFS